MKTRKKKVDARFINEEYLAYVHENAPKTKQLKTLIPAFLVGGAICSIGQIVSNLLKMWTSLDKEGIGAGDKRNIDFPREFIHRARAVRQARTNCGWRQYRTYHGLCKLNRISCDGI